GGEVESGRSSFNARACDPDIRPISPIAAGGVAESRNASRLPSFEKTRASSLIRRKSLYALGHSTRYVKNANSITAAAKALPPRGTASGKNAIGTIARSQGANA